VPIEEEEEEQQEEEESRHVLTTDCLKTTVF
jgi:hypothetical protein